MAKPESHSQCPGYSLSIPNVQELAASLDRSSSIPERYIRPETEIGPVNCTNEIELPVIKFEKLLDPKFSKEEATKLHSICQEWGIFQLINHGVPQELIEGLKDVAIEFFNKPLEEKMAYKTDPEGTLQGYGQVFVFSDEQKLEWSDILYVVTQPITHRNMKFLPTNPYQFRDDINKYSLELTKLATCLWQYIAKNLGVAPEVFAQMFRDHPQGLKFIYYPPCPEANKVLGASAHSDASGFSFVLEVISNGLYKSIEHRVMVNTEKERISLAAFHTPDSSIMLQPLPEVVGNGKQNYRSMSYQEFMKAYLGKKVDGKSAIEGLRL